MLCEHCLEMLDLGANPLDPSTQTRLLKKGIHLPSSATFYLSLQNNCNICTSLFRSFPPSLRHDLEHLDHVPDIAHEDLGFSRFDLWNRDQDKLELQIYFPRAKSSAIKFPSDWQGMKWKFSWIFHPISGPQAPEIAYNQHHLSSSTGSSKTLDLVKTWVQRCISTHVKCQEAHMLSDPPFYPSRLIEVGTASQPQMRLLDSAGSADNLEGRYVTLSHCWGTAPITTLTTSNEKKMRLSIPLEELPTTFREAIQVARALQVKYIWIDSLCIMQDSPVDWLREASTMAEVYSNSLCNIAATKASNASDGLFTTRNPFVYNPWSSFAIMKHISGRDQVYFRKDTMYWASRVDTAPLIKRAWVIQERILAPRVVHFASDQVLWECKQGVACEEYPNGLPFPESKLVEVFTPLHLNINSTVMRSDTESRLTHLSIWERIVECYSKSQLTRSSDKLAAISGLAKRMQSLMESEYLAGLWKFSVVKGMLWMAASHGESRRSSSYRAPSWSWASIDGEVQYSGSDHVPPYHQDSSWGEGVSRWPRVVEMISLLDFHITHVAKDRYMDVETGYLRFSGHLHPAYIELKAHATDMRFLEDTKLSRVIPDELPHIPTGYGSIEMEVYILPIIHSGEGEIQGLALTPAAGMPQGYYTRFGFLQQISARSVQGEPSDPMDLGHKDLTKGPQSEAWYEAGRGGDFVFSII